MCPLRYTPPIGPKMDFLVSYDYLASNTVPNDTFPNFGANKYWTFNWVSYLTVDVSDNVIVRTRGGGSEYYPYPYASNLYSQAQLVNVSAGVYQRQLPDGSIEVFNQADGSGRIFMTEVIDPQGNSATIQYDVDFRITSVTDAIGQQTTLTYLSSNPLLPAYYYITQITDPFSRSCSFTYGDGGSSLNCLISITDAVGLTSKFHYNGINNKATFIDWMTTPYGTTSFCTYSPDTTLPSTALQCTYPDGTTLVILGILWTGETYFWDREAMKRYPSDIVPVGGVITEDHATKTRWCYAGGPFPDYVLSAVPSYVKPPLENQISYEYPGGFIGPDGEYVIGNINLPSAVTRDVGGGTTQTWRYTYNVWGHTTQTVDPVGRTFTYSYAANGIDLVEKDQSGAVEINGIWTGYSNHLPSSYKDGSGQTTAYTYNGYGELLTLTNPNSDVWTYTYDGDGYLNQIEGPLSGSSDVTTISYDGYGRVYQVTNSEGYTLTYSYDAMNRITQITYPDGTSNQTVYDKRDVVLTKDRLGRWTQRSYDSMDQLAYEIDPLGRKTQYKWCTCGSLKSLTDPKGNKTSWDHDLEGRIVQKNYPDQSRIFYSYDDVGRLELRKDHLGQDTNYSYNLDNSLYQVTYSGAINPTSDVTYSYDRNYLRPTKIVNGWGTISYSYYPCIRNYSTVITGGGKLSKVTNSVIANSDTTYTYDAVGRITHRSINGVVNPMSWSYDAMSRVTSETNVLGTFNYAYVDDVSGYSKGTTHLSSISYPSGQTTHFNWFGNLGDERLEGIINLRVDGKCFSQFNYGYDSVGEITTWQQQQGTTNQQFFNYEYDTAGQLTTAKSGAYGSKSVPHTSDYIYSYDKGANKTGTQQYATMSGSIDGSITPGDIVTLTVYDAGLPGGQEAVDYTVQSGDDLIAVAGGLMTALNGDTNLQNIGVSGDNFGSNTFVIWSYSLNASSFIGSTSGGSTETITLAQPFANPLINATIVGTATPADVVTITVHDPALPGGLGVESVPYTVQPGDGLEDIAIGLTNAINGDATLTGIGVSAFETESSVQISSSSTNVTTYTQSISTGATENVVFSVNQNMNIGGAIAGTATPGDVLTIAAYDAFLPGGTKSVMYTVQSGDGLNDIATGLVNAVLADTDLNQIIAASPDGSNINLYSTSINATTYRATGSAGATATIVLGSFINSGGATLGSAQYQYNNVNELVSIGSNGLTEYQGTTNKAITSASVATNGFSVQRTPLNKTTYGTPEFSSATATIEFRLTVNGNTNFLVGGSPTTDDVMSVIVYNKALPNGQEQVFYTVQIGDGVNDVATGLSNAINADVNIAALGITSNAVTDTVFINQPSTTYSVSASGGATEWIWLGNNNDGNAVAEIDGNITASDVLTLTVNDPRLGGGTESVNYTVQPGDTNLTVAAGVAALINGNTNLTNIGVTAVTDAPATLSWSEAFTANQLTPGWNQTEVSATDAVPNTTTVPYSIFPISPVTSTPTYDLNGNMTSDGTNTYLWDAENRLIEIDYPGIGNNSVFTYDGLGHCVKIVETVSSSVTSTKQFVWCGNKMCEARDAGGTITNRYFDYGEKISSTSYYYNKDYLGSIRELTDGNSILSQYNFTPYGQAMKFSESVPSDFQYAGYYYHAPSGLNLTLSRAYSAQLGRWINRDPIEESGGLNLYDYVANNPIALTDPLGLQCIAMKNPFLRDDGSKESSDSDAQSSDTSIPTVVEIPPTEGINPDTSVDLLIPTIFAPPLRSILKGLPGVIRAPLVPIRATQGLKIVFKHEHAIRHMKGSNINPLDIERAIEKNITDQWRSGAKFVNDFRGVINVNGKTIGYRASGRPDGSINVGTYFVPHPGQQF